MTPEQIAELIRRNQYLATKWARLSEPQIVGKLDGRTVVYGGEWLHTDLPALLAAAEQAEKMREALEEMVEWYGNPHREEFLDCASWGMAMAVADRARAALAPADQKETTDV